MWDVPQMRKVVDLQLCSPLQTMALLTLPHGASTMHLSPNDNDRRDGKANLALELMSKYQLGLKQPQELVMPVQASPTLARSKLLDLPKAPEMVPKLA